MLVSVKVDGIEKISKKINDIFFMAKELEKEVHQMYDICNDAKFEIIEKPIEDVKNGCIIEIEK